MIRLARIGSKNNPLYRLAISEKRKDAYGDHLEILGSYNPRTKNLELKKDRVEYWISKGAQLSATVNNLLITKGIIKGEKEKSRKANTKRLVAKRAENEANKKKAEEAAKAAAEASKVAEEAAKQAAREAEEAAKKAAEEAANKPVEEAVIAPTEEISPEKTA